MRFYAKSGDFAQGVDKYEVLYSATTVSPSAFTALSEVVTTGNTWELHEVTLPANARYFAIRCVSDDGFVLMVDDLEFIEIPPKGGVLLDTNALTVEAFPLYHRVPCVGFIFREKEKLRHINGEMVKFYDVPVRLIPDIKAGADLVLPDGRIIDNSIME